MDLEHCLAGCVSWSIRCPFVDDKMYIPLRAVDPDSLNPDPDTDPDPAFQVNLDSIRILGFFSSFSSKIAIYFSLGLHKGRL
jgi:hypothetical protein